MSQMKPENGQPGAGDAGLAALVTLLRFHGIGADQEQIRHQCGGVAIGVPEMLRVAKAFGLKTRAYRSDEMYKDRGASWLGVGLGDRVRHAPVRGVPVEMVRGVDGRGRTPQRSCGSRRGPSPRSAPPNGDWASGKRCQASIGGWACKEDVAVPRRGYACG